MRRALEASVDVYGDEQESELMDGRFWSLSPPPAGGVMGCWGALASSGG